MGKKIAQREYFPESRSLVEKMEVASRAGDVSRLYQLGKEYQAVFLGDMTRVANDLDVEDQTFASVEASLINNRAMVARAPYESELTRIMVYDIMKLGGMS